MFSGNFKSALTNIRQNKWRSFLTMLGIIIGVTSVVTVVSLGEGLKSQVVGQINQLGSDVLTIRSGRLTSEGVGSDSLNILAFLSTSTLTDDDVSAIAKLPEVSAVVPINFVTNTATAEQNHLDNIFVIGTTSDMTELLNQKVAYGSFFSDEAGDSNYAVIGPKIAAQLLGKINPIGHTIKIAGTEFVVGGVLERSAGGLLSVAQTDFNSAVFIPLAKAKELTGGRTNILQILAKNQDPNIEHTVSQVEKTLLSNHRGQLDFSVLQQYELLNIANSVVNQMTAFISVLAAVSLIIGGIGIMSIMLVSVSERTREIGIRKAVGANNRQILNQFLAEGMALSIGGGIIGIVIALAVNGLLRVYTNLEPVINLQVLVLAAAVSVAVGVIFGVAPAIKAARKNPIDALRNG
jgi:ABC-type antimicrobial peptide transport system permease subunit